MKIVLNGCGLEMSDERYEIVEVTSDDREGVPVHDSLTGKYFMVNEPLVDVKRLVDDWNHLIESRESYRKNRNDALSENEKLWNVVDGFKSLLELEFEGKI